MVDIGLDNSTDFVLFTVSSVVSSMFSVDIDVDALLSGDEVRVIGIIVSSFETVVLLI